MRAAHVNAKNLVGVLVVAACATTADYIWYTYGVHHTMVAGLVHGTLLLTSVGAVLGVASGHALKGLPIGALAGIVGAASYYVLVAVMDRRTYGTAIPAAWIIMWLTLAALDGRWLRAPGRRSWRAVAARGLLAAVLGGVAFYLVLTTLWGRPPADGRNYALQFLTWAFAWAPGLLALTADCEPAATIRGAELIARIDRHEALAILDVRTAAEFAMGHVPGAVNIPFTEIASRIHAVPGSANDDLVLYCGHGPRAWVAAAALRRHGRTRLVHLDGHWSAWQRAGLRVER